MELPQAPTPPGLEAVNELLRRKLRHGPGPATNTAAVQRCQWHKRRNVLGCLPAGLQPEFKPKADGGLGEARLCGGPDGLEAGAGGAGEGERLGGGYVEEGLRRC